MKIGARLYAPSISRSALHESVAKIISTVWILRTAAAGLRHSRAPMSLAILATEFAWAGHWLQKARDFFHKQKEKFKRKRQ